MTNPIDQRRDEVTKLCRQFGVRRLEIFGSASSGIFDPQRSDLDFLVDLDPNGGQSLFHRYFGLDEALAKLLRRKVDLVMVGAMRNPYPYFIESVHKTRQLVYAASLAETA